MGSVSKLVLQRKRARVEETAHAVYIQNAVDRVLQVKTSNLRGNIDDGRIKGLSAHALSRLRDAIARTAHVSMDYSVYGCCLTIPWGDKDPDAPGNPTRADAAKIWRRWTHNLGRLLDSWNIGIIYRVELQTRRAVHWHMMVYLPNRVNLQAIVNALAQSIMKVKCSLTTARKKSGRSMIDCGSNVGHAYLMHLLRLSWINAVNQVHDEIRTGAAWSALVAPVAPGSDHAAPSDIKSLDYCFDSIPLDGVKSGIAYLASHTTKHKQDQLGYDGKQWGYLGRKWLVEPSPRVLELSGVPDDVSYRARVLAYRTIRHWCKVNRALTDWRTVRPSSKVVGDDESSARVYCGLVSRNPRPLYLFGTPGEVVRQAFDCALQNIGG